MSIGVKLFIQTFLILLIVIVSGGYVYVKSIDAVFENQFHKDMKHDTIRVKNYIQNIQNDIQVMAHEIVDDESIKASINLISKYEDRQNYRAIIFDNEKRQLLSNIEKYSGAHNAISISFFNDLGELIVRKERVDDTYISWEKGMALLVSSSGITPLQNLPIVDISIIDEVKTRHKKEQFVFDFIQEIRTTQEVIGYLQVSYHLGMDDIEYLQKNLINGLYFRIGKDHIISTYQTQDFTQNQVEISEALVHENGLNLYANYIIDKSFLEEEKKSIINTLMLMAIVLAAVSFLIAWYFSKHLVVDRLVRLKESIESIKHDKYEKIENSTKDELGEIIDDFNEVFEKFSQNYSFLESYKKSVDTTNIVSTTDLRGRITYVNDEFVKISGFSQSELLGKSHNMVRHPDMKKEVFKELWETILSGKVWRGIIKNKTKNGGSYWADSVISPVFDSEGKIKEFISIRRDITELVEQKEQMQKIADYDLITGLGSRNKLQGDLKLMEDAAVAVVNINRFSQINDFYGHRFGDIVLKKVAKKLQKVVAQNFENEVTLYRPNGDEYVILSQDSSGDFAEKIQKVLQSIEEDAIRIGEEEVDINVSCGVSLEKIDMILLTADMALKISKKENKTLTIYSQENSLNEIYQNNIEWTKKLKSAIAQDRILPFFQPLVNNKTLQYEKYEALVRMIDEEGKVISPFFFLDIAKQTKQYPRLTKIMLEKSFAVFANRKESFSINLTAEDILNPDVAEHIVLLLQKYPQIGDRVVFEIVESESIESYDEVVDFIDRAKHMGCRIAIDDFGTGYSNFEYLIKLKADFIKIDGSLIKNIVSNKESFVVVSVIVSFAKQMGIKTVAEFVENGEILKVLQELGVDYSQGYHFSPPLQNVN